MIIEMSKHPWKWSKVSNELESRYWCDQLYSSALFFSNIYDFGSEFKIIVMLKMKLLPIDCFNDVKFQAVERPVNQTMKLLPIRSFPDCIAQSKSDATFLCLHCDKTSNTTG